MILALNAGSSSIKFALFPCSGTLRRLLSGEISRIGDTESQWTASWEEGNRQSHLIQTKNHSEAERRLTEWLDSEVGLDHITAIGHRIVHGMNHHRPQLVTPSLLKLLHDISVIDPEHLPSEIQLIESFQQRLPGLPQVVCFDTAFHHEMPRVARLLSIPRRFQEKGVQRYGFHGISYQFLMEELARISSSEAQGRIILLHLGNGASLAAVHNGRSMDTSMGFTPSSGIPMGTRSGDLDPGLVDYLARTENMNSSRFHQMVNHESGLLGVSETTADMRALLSREDQDERAVEAIALFCYQIKKWIGAFAVVLGGLDTLVFSGGIGANAPQIRERTCDGLDFLGVELHPGRNNLGEAKISTDASSVCVRVMETNEEMMIARATANLLQNKEKGIDS